MFTSIAVAFSTLQGAAIAFTAINVAVLAVALVCLYFAHRSVTQAKPQIAIGPAGKPQAKAQNASRPATKSHGAATQDKAQDAAPADKTQGKPQDAVGKSCK